MEYKVAFPVITNKVRAHPLTCRIKHSIKAIKAYIKAGNK